MQKYDTFIDKKKKDEVRAVRIHYVVWELLDLSIIASYRTNQSLDLVLRVATHVHQCFRGIERKGYD